MTKRRGWGTLKQIRGKNWRASYTGPDGVVYAAPHTYTAKIDGEAWLAKEKRKIDLDIWEPPNAEKTKGLTFGEYADRRVAQRTLTPRTRSHYQDLLRLHIKPTFGSVQLAAISVSSVQSWYSNLLPGKPTARAHAYSLLHSILRDAVRGGLIPTNPAVESGAMNARRTRTIRYLTPAQLDALIIAAPDRFKAALSIAGWCGLRAGELKALRFEDIAEDGSSVHVEHSVTYRSGVYHLGPPKTDAGVRTVSMPTRGRAVLVEHMKSVSPGELVFQGNGGVEGYMTDWDLRRAVAVSGLAIGIPDLRPHELRHTAATLAARTGATTKDIMARIGHSTMNAALLYQGSSTEQDQRVADGLDSM